MPRVETKTKIRLGADRRCGKCGDPIEPGTQYRQWSFRYGGTYYRCMKYECRPRQSDLTQSKMAQVYSATEAAEDELPNLHTPEEIVSAMEAAAGSIREVAEEYQEAAEAMEAAGYEMEEKADALSEWADEIEQFDPADHTDFDFDAEAAEDEDEDEDEDYDSDGPTLEEALADVRAAAEEILNEVPV